MQRSYRISLILSVVLLSACAAHPRHNYYSYQQSPVAGVLLGGAGGAMIGHAIDEEHGAYLGAITGAVVGGVTDYYINKGRQRENRGYSYRGRRKSGAYHRSEHGRHDLYH
ncbi:MAG: glycine zipper 2TM domain-containing protein [Methylomarinum sp.]|nr:glycine zipper 2TM domain-containing protein [Methylomarinum sp.]